MHSQAVLVVAQMELLAYNSPPPTVVECDPLERIESIIHICWASHIHSDVRLWCLQHIGHPAVYATLYANIVFTSEVVAEWQFYLDVVTFTR